MIPRLLALGLALCVAAPDATAAPITTLHSTGTAGAGGADANYALVSAPGGYATAFVATETAGFPFDFYWASNGFTPAGAPASAWIAPTADVNTTHPDGYYTYRTTFDLTGFVPATAVVAGFLAADNAVDVYLNGVLVAQVYAQNGYSFTPASFARQPLSIGGGFAAGLNTLDFKVYNEVQASGNPTGLRVALAGTADPAPALAPPAPVPEPASVVALGVGVVAAGYIRRRRATG